MWYLVTVMQILPGEPHQKICILSPESKFLLLLFTVIFTVTVTGARFQFTSVKHSYSWEKFLEYRLSIQILCQYKDTKRRKFVPSDMNDVSWKNVTQTENSYEALSHKPVREEIIDMSIVSENVFICASDAKNISQIM